MQGAESDADLLESWRAGDLGAASRLFERHAGAVGRVFRFKVDSALDDLVQQTFLHCVERRDAIDERGLRGYLLGVAHNVLRKHLEQMAGPRGRVDPATTSMADLDGGSPSSVIALSQSRRVVVEALRGLPLDLQTALELYYWEGLTAPQIARVLEVPEGTVRSRLRIGRERLRDSLASLDPSACDELDQRVRATR